MANELNSKQDAEVETVRDEDGPASEKKSGKKRKLYTVTFYSKWCKSCGLCSALCVKKIIQTDKGGLPFITNDAMDRCYGCRFCEIHCPDFAITIKNRHPGRRVSDTQK